MRAYIDDPLLTPAEVAAQFGVTEKTVSRWARKGCIKFIQTPGGRRRFRESEVRALVEGNTDDSDDQ